MLLIYGSADCVTVSTVGGEIIVLRVKPMIRRTIIPIQPLVYIISPELNYSEI